MSYMGQKEKINIEGSWKDLGLPYNRIGGTWRPCKQVWTKVNGTWQKLFDVEIPDTFDGSGSLTYTPGDANWKVYKGSFSKSSGNAVAGSLPSVAGIETGETDITLDVDSGNAALSGTGAAFWIVDQNNWWGSQIYIEKFGYQQPQAYNYICYETFYFSAAESGPVIGYNFTEFRNVGAQQSNGIYNLRKIAYCITGWVNNKDYQQFGNCEASCGNGNPQSECPSNYNGPIAWNNCGNQGDCSGCGPAPNSGAYNSGFSSNPPGGFSFYAACPHGGWPVNVNYVSPAVYAPWTCRYPVISGPTEISRGNNAPNSDPRNYTGPTCAPYGTRVVSCPQITWNFTVPANGVYKRTRVLRSQNGNVSVQAQRDVNQNMGGLRTNLNGNTITVTSYAGAVGNTTAYPSQVYNVPSTTPKGTKHGILVAAVPTYNGGNYNVGPGAGVPAYNQNFTITRFKATY